MGWHSAIASYCGFRGDAYPWRRRTQFRAPTAGPRLAARSNSIAGYWAQRSAVEPAGRKYCWKGADRGKQRRLPDRMWRPGWCRRQGNPGTPKGMERMSDRALRLEEVRWDWDSGSRAEESAK